MVGSQLIWFWSWGSSLWKCSLRTTSDHMCCCWMATPAMCPTCNSWGSCRLTGYTWSATLPTPPTVCHQSLPYKSLFKSLKHHWNEEGRSFMRQTRGRKLLNWEFFSLFGRAWQKATTVQTAQAGFRGTGMFPVNPMVLHPSVYEPSLTTERPLQPAEQLLEPAERPVGSEGEGRAELPEQLPNICDRIGAEVAVGEEVTDRGEEEVFVPPPVVATGVERMTFAMLLPIPKREKGQTGNRSKPPSYHLTGDEHFSYIAAKNTPKMTKSTKKQKQQRWWGRVQAWMARTFAIFAKPDTVLRMIPRRVRIGSCAWFVRSGSMKHVVRRMASLKRGFHLLWLPWCLAKCPPPHTAVFLPLSNGF